MRLPDLPVIVMVTVPVLAELLAESVSVLVPVAGLGLKEADVPLRKPEAEKVTPELKPLEGVMVIVAVPLAPRAMLKVVGKAERVKFGWAVTVREIMVELVKLAHIPVTVTLNVPVAAAALAVRVRVLAPVVLAGLKDAVTPLGRPEATKLTMPLKPLSGLTVIVLVPLALWAMLSELGVAESV